MDFSTRQFFEKFSETKRMLEISQVKVMEEGSTESQLLAISAYLFKLHRSQGDEHFAKMVESFEHDLQGVFLVPKLLFRQLHHQKNEIVAAFIDFLLRVLCHKTDSIYSSGDRNLLDVLNKELRFLLVVLGDKVLLSGEVEKDDNLMAEFEAVANEAGRLVYSFIYSTDDDDDDRVVRMDALLEHIDLLKANLTKFLTLLSCISKAHNVSRNSASVHSLYIIDSLVRDLEDLINEKDDWIVDDVKDQMKMLHQELMFSQSLLKDISLPGNSEIPEMKEIMIQNRDLAFEAEYLINSFLVGDAPIWYLTIRLTNVIHMVKYIGSEMKQIKKNYDVGALKAAEDFSAKLSLQLKRNSDIVDDIIVGFDDCEIDILDHLVRGTERLQIISIFGMPGLGKTTLAKKLYKNPSVNYHFDKCSWCVVSQTYDRKNLLIDILMSLASGLDEEEVLNIEEERLAELIYRSLKGRRYMIVMDDIWDSKVWYGLRRYFPDDVTGSRILFTTRIKDVAPPDSIIYALPSLSNDQCWELLEKKVFHHTSCPPQLLGIGKEIAGNCNGLPIAVAAIAGILSTMDKGETSWKNVAESLNSYIFSDQNNVVMQILKLSYEHLPEYLKPCFLYFGAFPEDEEIHVKKLMRLWIAEGFIRKEEEKSAESTAEEYLLELIAKSLVIVSKRRSDGGVKACVVHDLMRDLCLRIAEEENFLKLMDNNYSMYTNHQRIRFDVSPFDLMPFGSHVRSIFCGRSFLGDPSFFHSIMDSPLYVLKMKSLRVMDLRNNWLKHGVGIELVTQLRYLVIINMPLESIGNLVKLECLTINTGRLHLDFIFSIIHQNPKLKYLNAPFLVTSERDCNTLETNNLEYLSSFSISKLKDEEILKCSPHLRRLTCVCVSLLEDDGVFRYPNLHFLTQLESLYMSANTATVIQPPVQPESISSELMFELLDMLESISDEFMLRRKIADINLPSNLKKLTLSYFNWPWEKASVIGRLHNLRVLKLNGNAFDGERWETRDGEFQQLRFLQLVHLDFTHWNVASREHFPKLEQLVLQNCYFLQEIPCEIGDIATLQLIEVSGCSEALSESAREIQKQQLDMGNEELKVIIKQVAET